MKKILLLVCFFTSVYSFAQNEGSDPSKEIRISKKAEVLREMDKGVFLMDAGEYIQADEKFRYALKNLTIIPANLAYYIGKNSFYLQETKQSIDWLTKYIEIKGTSGQYYEEASALLKKAEETYSASPESLTDQEPLNLDSIDFSRQIDCDITDIFKCPVCVGRAVIIEPGPLKTIYKPCPYSDKNGLLTCEEYNLLMNGKLKPRTQP